MPLLLLLSDGGTIGTIALVGMLMFHVHIFSTFAMGVPMEWNLFMIFGLLLPVRRVRRRTRSGNLDNPLLWVLLALIGVVDPDDRQPAARQDLLPAVDALLRGQLGDEHVALPQGHGRGGASSTGRSRRSRRSPSSS